MGKNKKILKETEIQEIVISCFPFGFFFFDNENKLISVNSKVENLFKIKSKEIIGKSFSQLMKFPQLAPLFEEKKQSFKKETQIKENIFLEILIKPVFKEKRKAGTLIVLNDVSEKKQKEKIKREFIKLLIHQLRTPVSAIKWAAQMCFDDDAGSLSEKQKDFLDKISHSNERMILLINNLFEVMRIEEGKILNDLILTDITSIFNFMIKSFKGKIEEKNLKVIFIKPKEILPLLLIDPEKIKLAIGHLLDNAIRYNRPGGEIIISIKKPTKKEVEFSIKNTGIGIHKNQQENVFSKFFRGANAMRIETIGTGLGLFIVKNIIKAHGGKIWFKSKENKGSIFYFTLPLK